MTRADPLPPAAIAAARGAVKAYLRLADDGEDALIDTLAATAIELAEAFLGQATIARGFAASVAADGRWRVLPVAPVLAITGVADASGQAWPADACAVAIAADSLGWARVLGVGSLLGDAPVATVTCRAGLATTWDMLPAPVAQGAVMLAAHLFDQRDATAAPPAAVTALWRPYRRVTLGARRAVCA